MGGFKDFAKRVDSGQVKGGTQPPRFMGWEEREDEMNKERASEYEEEIKNKKEFQALLLVGGIAGFILNGLPGLVLGILIALLFGVLYELLGK